MRMWRFLPAGVNTMTGMYVQCAANIQHNYNFPEQRHDIRNHTLFLAGKIKICFLSIAALSRIPANADDCRIAHCSSLRQKLCWDLRLCSTAGFAVFSVLLRHILSIEVMQRLKKRDFSLVLLFFHTVTEISDIRNGHVAAAASASYIVRTGLAEQSNTAPLTERQQMVFIFQQHHALGSRHP